MNGFQLTPDAQDDLDAIADYVATNRWEVTPIQIVAIVHGARNLQAFFRRRVR